MAIWYTVQDALSSSFVAQSALIERFRMILLERHPKETARDFAIRVLLENIVTTALEPGCMVSENELASEMGLSRTPVREALIELSKSGIVEIYPQHGSMVSRIDYDKVEEASFTRRVLETAVVGEVCLAAQPHDLRDLEDNLAIQDFYLEKGDAERLLVLDNEFHRHLFRIAKKMLSYQLMSSLSAHFDRVRRLSLVAIKDIRIVEDHHRILNAIKSLDAEQARQAMADHLLRYQLDKTEISEKYSRFLA